jgi:crotonobetaine/carnitine-CoA ligase
MKSDMTRFPEGQCFPADVCVVRPVLDRLAASQPDKVFVRFVDGSSWSYREFRDVVVRTAAGFQNIGVAQGDHVLLWLPNGADMLRAIFALNYLGAVCVPINTAYRGQLLEHVLANADARVMVAHADLVARLRDVNPHQLKTLVVSGDSSLELPGLELLPVSMLDKYDGELRPLERAIQPWDTQSIIYTSGTTGPSKGVLSSYMHAYSSVGPQTWTCVTGDDRFLINLPMFHIGGIFICHAMLCAGGSIAMIERFSTELFWYEVRDTGASVAFLLGSMASFLLQRPATVQDRDHPLRRVFLVPLLKGAAGFGERFGVETYTLFNMTEIATPTISGPNPGKPGSCGKAREGVEIRLVDQHDCEVARGEIGEMIVRTQRPWAMNHGYQRAPEATARAWRNGWFHTGDAFYIDADGDYMFVDRLKDVIRRRGENISSVEVEAELLAYPGVREAAAVPVPSEFGEDEVMGVVSLLPDQPPLDFTAFIGFLCTRLPHFMVPRYLRVLTELPKTPTAKVMKAVLRKDGITADTWDRVEAGVQVKRERLN